MNRVTMLCAALLLAGEPLSTARAADVSGGSSSSAAAVLAGTTYITDAGTCALSGGVCTKTVTSGSVCVSSDGTSALAVGDAVSGATLTLAGTGTDTVSYICAQGQNTGTCTLNGASPSVCTSAVSTGGSTIGCVANTATALSLITAVSSNTLTVTGPNGSTAVVSYVCGNNPEIAQASFAGGAFTGLTSIGGNASVCAATNGTSARAVKAVVSGGNSLDLTNAAGGNSDNVTYLCSGLGARQAVAVALGFLGGNAAASQPLTVYSGSTGVSNTTGGLGKAYVQIGTNGAGQANITLNQDASGSNAKLLYNTNAVSKWTLGIGGGSAGTDGFFLSNASSGHNIFESNLSTDLTTWSQAVTFSSTTTFNGTIAGTAVVPVANGGTGNTDGWAPQINRKVFRLVSVGISPWLVNIGGLSVSTNATTFGSWGSNQHGAMTMVGKNTTTDMFYRTGLNESFWDAQPVAWVVGSHDTTGSTLRCTAGMYAADISATAPVIGSAAFGTRYAAARFDGAVNGGKWICGSGDGTNHSGIDMGTAPVAQSTYNYLVKTDLNYSTAATLTCTVYRADTGAIVAGPTTKTTNLPSGQTAMGYGWDCITTSGGGLGTYFAQGEMSAN